MTDRIDELLESRGLPSYIEAEQIVLGSATLHPEAFDEIVRCGHLFRYELFLDSHKLIFSWMEQLRAKAMPLTLATLCDGRSEVQIERAGGRSYLCKLGDYATSPDTLKFYADKIREKSDLRKLIAVNRLAMIRALEGDESPQSIIETAHHEIEGLREKAAQGTKPRFELIPASELDRLPQSEFLPGTHIVRRMYNLAYGLSDTGKSLWALKQAAIVSQYGAVIYACAEGSGGLAGRCAALKARGFDLGQLYFVTEAINLLDPQEVASFIADCKAKFPDGVLLIVFDTKSRMMAGADENNAKDDSQQVDNCNRIQRELGSAILMIHHSGKADLSGPRGSGVTFNAADCVVHFRRDGDLITVSVQSPAGKLKDGSKWPDETFSFVQAADSVVLEPADKVATEYSPIDATDEKILRALLSVGAVGSSPTQLKRLTEQDLSERTLYDRLRKLRDCVPPFVLVEYCKKPRRSTYFISEAGCKLLRKPDEISQPYKPNGESELVGSTAELQEYCKGTASNADCTAARLSSLREPQHSSTRSSSYRSNGQAEMCDSCGAVVSLGEQCDGCGGWAAASTERVMLF